MAVRGVVYKARQLVLNRDVALKMVLAAAHAAAAERARFRTEAEAAARLQHPNIVQVFEVGEANGHMFLALEYVPGGTLALQLAGQPQRPAVAASLVETLARAVEHAHRQGIIHRDLKPANVLLAADGAPKITDFGLAKLLDRQDTQTATGSIVGTPCYMAPEQAAGQTASATVAVDVYALGAILYEMLTGRPPFRANDLLETLRQVVTEDPLPPERLQPGTPRDLATICMKCLQKEPAKRYADARALAEDLRRYLAGEPILARPAGVWERGWKWAKRRPSTAAFLAVSLAAGLSLLLGSLWYNGRLAEAVVEAQSQRTEADRATAEALARGAVIRQQYETARRTMMTLQLAQVEEIWKTDSPRARKLLEDPERCPPELRDFAWGMYYHLCTRDRIVDLPQSYKVEKIALKPDGTTLATSGNDGRIRLWDATTGKETATLAEHGRGAPCLTFSPHGQVLASGGTDRLVHLCDTATGQETGTLKGHTGAVLAVAFAPDGRTLASSSHDTTIRLWRLPDQQLLATLRGHTGPVQALTFSSDGHTLSSAGRDGVRLWDVAREEESGSFALKNASDVQWLAGAPDGKQLALFSLRSRTVSFWDAGARQHIKEFQGLTSHIRGAALSADALSLALAQDDQTIRVCDPATGVERYSLWTSPRPVIQLAFAADGRTLATLTDDRLTCYLWSTETRQRNAPAPAGENQRLTCLATSADGKTLAAGDSEGLIRLWDAQSLREQAPLGHHGGRLWAVAFAPTSPVLATAGEDHHVQLWNLDTRRIVQSLRGHQKRVRQVAFSANGAAVATASEDGTVRLWNPKDGSELGALQADGAEMMAVTFTPDGKSLITGSADGVVRIWDVATHQVRAVRSEHTKSVLFAVCSADGRRLATGGPDGTVKLWDMEPFAVRLTLQGHRGFAFSAAFTPDGQTLATGSGFRRTINVPGEVKLWDVATGHCRATLHGQTGPVAFINSGKSLVTADHFTSIKGWPSIQPFDPPGATVPGAAPRAHPDQSPSQ